MTPVGPSGDDDYGRHPVSSVEWVDPADLRPNDWNPNRHTTQTLDLLWQSMITDGWTHPILATQGGVIIDGQHRWRLACERIGLPAKVPVVRINAENEADLMAATVRHNRARGVHTVEKMMPLVQRMTAEGGSPEELIGLDRGERRLLDRQMPALLAGAGYNLAWVPAEKPPTGAPDGRETDPGA